eukprot:14365988-Alexandrium_andersonii.AAC.1
MRGCSSLGFGAVSERGTHPSAAGGPRGVTGAGLRRETSRLTMVWQSTKGKTRSGWGTAGEGVRRAAAAAAAAAALTLSVDRG